MDDAKFKAQLQEAATKTENSLKAWLLGQGNMGTVSEANKMQAGDAPQSLLDAMAYSALDGGKRFRPFLVHATAALFDSDETLTTDVATAIECIHSYSLIHDDLPDMDNDEMRRGKPTLWKAHGTAAAILAGDSLQTLAFEIISSNPTPANAMIKTQLVSGLAKASGQTGMVGGQVRDMAAENSDAPHSFADVIMIHSQKTGALIAFAAEAGAIIGNANHQAREALKLYGEKLGLAFQLRDDLLDIKGSAEQLGKTPGKDIEAGKATFVSVLGPEKAQTFLDNLRDGAHYALEPFGDKAETLHAAVEFVCKRKN